MLNISNLHKQIQEKEKRQIQTYQQMLEKCILHIKNVNDKIKYLSECLCLYTISEYTYGIPSYDVQGCIIYIMDYLAKRGFYVEYIQPNAIYINWSQKPSNNSITPEILDVGLINDATIDELIYNSSDLRNMSDKSRRLNF